ncbi:GNAT family N-acetyltransferase [Paraburkholderia nemoris]|uniref:GNAT family N-acetyltransferase n=1 Tax=Paraburkholderia nemoris TaxID=2793076 RepID=UPI0038BBA3E2
MADEKHERNARLWKRTLLANSGAGVRPANLRNVTRDDVPALGALLFGAFLGTIDDAGQAITQYESKATAIVAGRYGEWIAAASWAVEGTGGLRSACLVCDYKPYGCPAIAVVATTPSHKRTGDGGRLVDAALWSLGALGYLECCAMVTVGNDASEQLFESRGFSPETAAQAGTA